MCRNYKWLSAHKLLREYDCFQGRVLFWKLHGSFLDRLVNCRVKGISRNSQ